MKKINLLIILIILSSITYGSVNYSVTYNATDILENQLKWLNITFDSPYVYDTLWYNNTEYTTTRNVSGSNTTLTIQLNSTRTTKDVNVSFFWEYLSNLDDNFYLGIKNTISYFSMDSDTMYTNNNLVYDENNTGVLLSLTDSGTWLSDTEAAMKNITINKVVENVSLLASTDDATILTVWIEFRYDDGNRLNTSKQVGDDVIMTFLPNKTNSIVDDYTIWAKRNFAGGNDAQLKGINHSISETGLLTGYIFNHANKLNGLLQNSSNGKYGDGLFLDGVDDTARIEDVPELEGNKELTISAWFRPRKIGIAGSITETQNKGFIFDFTIANKIRFGVYNDAGVLGILQSTNAVLTTVDTWYHLAGSINEAGVLNLYVNGVNINSSTHGTWDSLDTLHTATYIGSNQDTEKWLNGSLDSLLIYNRSLSQTEIEGIYTNQTKYTPIGKDLIKEFAFENENTTHLFDENNLVVGKWDEANYFDGKSVYINISRPSLITNISFSYFNWFKTNTLTGSHTFFDNSAGGTKGITMFQTNTYSPRVNVWNNAGGAILSLFNASATITANTWHHTGMTYNGSIVKIYLDGKRVQEGALNSSDIGINVNSFLIGKRANNDVYFNGSIDDVLIFNRSLTTEEIGYLFNHTFKSNTTSLNQSVLNIAIDNCSTFIHPVLNFSYFDQVDSSSLFVVNAYDLLFSGYLDHTVQGTFTNNSYDTFCSSHNLDEFGLSYNVTGQLTLTKQDYATKLFDITSPLSLVTPFPVQQAISLIRLNESTTIKFEWLTTSFQPIDGTMVIYECNGDGTKDLISNVPIIDAEASENLELLTKTYSYEVTINGVNFQDNTSYTKCHIESSETRRFFVKVEGIDVTPVTGMYSIPCNFTQITDNQYSMIWGSNPESDSTITGCIKGYTSSVLGNTEISSDCSTTSSLTSTIVDPNVPYFTTATLFQNGYSLACGESFGENKDNSASDLFGLMGLFSVALLVMSGAFLFASDGESMVLGSALGILMAWFMGILAFGWPIVSLIVFLFVIIIIIGRYSRKKT